MPRAISGDEIKVLGKQQIHQDGDEAARIGPITIHGDNDIARSVAKACLVGCPVTLSFLGDHDRSKLPRNLRCAIDRVIVDDNDFVDEARHVAQRSHNAGFLVVAGHHG